jgi:hypothetical protein
MRARGVNVPERFGNLSQIGKRLRDRRAVFQLLAERQALLMEPLRQTILAEPSCNGSQVVQVHRYGCRLSKVTAHGQAFFTPSSREWVVAFEVRQHPQDGEDPGVPDSAVRLGGQFTPSVQSGVRERIL